ncbi:IS481 family transposase domain protein [Rickettsiales endosymbiont of Paramecium tredecaurelia]|nr:IS481 family transposase domain protein [Candidatus Sarmatiella mevalonica]
MGPKKIKSTVLSEAEEEAIVDFRQITQLPLDDVLHSTVHFFELAT